MILIRFKVHNSCYGQRLCLLAQGAIKRSYVIDILNNLNRPRKKHKFKINEIVQPNYSDNYYAINAQRDPAPILTKKKIA
jgi:hypothetical protein